MTTSLRRRPSDATGHLAAAVQPFVDLIDSRKRIAATGRDGRARWCSAVCGDKACNKRGEDEEGEGRI
jgi:hypothetical protein